MRKFITKQAFVITSILILIIAASCNKYKNMNVSGLVLDQNIPVYDQQFSESENAVIHLGRVLFYDKNLSVNNSVSCASCHKQSLAFADNVAKSVGFESRLTTRNSIAIQNLIDDKGGINPPFFIESKLFWDGREKSLTSLISRPIANHIEMGMDDETQLLEKLNKLTYIKTLCSKAYGNNVPLDMMRLSTAMTSFLAQIKSNKSKFDLSEGFPPATVELNALESHGRNLFITTYQCNNCHNPSTGPYFSEGFVNIGLDATDEDNGHMNVSKSSSDKGKFKVPDLHNVGITAPYMHDGRFKTLDEVLEHYSHGIQSNSNLDDRLKNIDGTPIKMNITESDKKALIAFLNTMTDYEMITNPLFANPFKSK